MTPEYMLETFVQKSSHYDLRRTSIKLPKPKTDNCKRTFMYRGAMLYNEIPLDTKQSHSLKEFNRRVNQDTHRTVQRFSW